MAASLSFFYNKLVITLCKKSGERFEALLRLGLEALLILAATKLLLPMKKNTGYSGVQTEVLKSSWVLSYAGALGLFRFLNWLRPSRFTFSIRYVFSFFRVSVFFLLLLCFCGFLIFCWLLLAS